MYTKSVKKAAYIIYYTNADFRVVEDRYNKHENAFYFDNTDMVRQAVREYKYKIEHRIQLVEDRDIWRYERIIGDLKKQVVKYKQGISI